MSKPETFSIDLSNLPPALRPLTSERRWVVWRWVERKANGSAKWTKPPFKPLYPRTQARSNTPSTWGTYADAIAAVQAGNADGIGLMLFGCDVAAVDIDKCRTVTPGVNGSGKLDPWAQAIVDEASAAGCYIEATVSGTGVRVLALSAGAELHRRWATNGQDGAGIELYRNTPRYITISGCEISRCDKLPESDFFDALYKRYVEYPPKTAKAKGNGAGPSFDFNEAPEQDADIEDVIINGAPEGSRSEAFQRVVSRLAELGNSVDEIEARLKQHPNGIAAKYSGRLRREVERSFEKWRARNIVTVTKAPAAPAAPGGFGPAGSGPGSGMGSGPPLQWDSLDKNGFPKPTCANARIAIQMLGIQCSSDEFHDALLLQSTKIGAYAGKVSDNAILHLRNLIHRAHLSIPPT